LKSIPVAARGDPFAADFFVLRTTALEREKAGLTASDQDNWMARNEAVDGAN
jgi:hypothetical protein